MRRRPCETSKQAETNEGLRRALSAEREARSSADLVSCQRQRPDRSSRFNPSLPCFCVTFLPLPPLIACTTPPPLPLLPYLRRIYLAQLLIFSWRLDLHRTVGIRTARGDSRGRSVEDSAFSGDGKPARMQLNYLSRRKSVKSQGEPALSAGTRCFEKLDTRKPSRGLCPACVSRMDAARCMFSKDCVGTNPPLPIRHRPCYVFQSMPSGGLGRVVFGGPSALEFNRPPVVLVW